MRWLGLYLRSRRAPVAVVAAAGGAAAVWSLWWALGDGTMPPQWVALTAMLTVAAVAHTLGGADEALDRTAARPWPPRRGAHLLAALALLTGLLLLTTATPAPIGPAGLVVRDTAGLLGLTALSAAVLGAHRAWFLPVGWTLLVVPFSPVSDKVHIQVLAWMAQPASSGAAAVAAALLAGLGAAGYIRFGSASFPDDRERSA